MGAIDWLRIMHLPRMVRQLAPWPCRRETLSLGDLIAHGLCWQRPADFADRGRPTESAIILSSLHTGWGHRKSPDERGASYCNPSFRYDRKGLRNFSRRSRRQQFANRQSPPGGIRDGRTPHHRKPTAVTAISQCARGWREYGE